MDKAPNVPDVGSDADDVTAQSINGTPAPVGGIVRNSAPTFQSLAPDATTGDNRGGFVVIFSGVVRDANTERLVKSISIGATGPITLGATRTLTPADADVLSKPDTFGVDGFRVWTGTKNDGLMNFEYRQAFPAFTPAGSYIFTGIVTDIPGLSATSSPITITVTPFSDITISATPVNAAGAALAGQNWGQWDAEAGATNVASTNYIKLANTGADPTSRVVIDFGPAFVGTDDPEFTIATANNIQFATWTGALPQSAAPTWSAATEDAAVTIAFGAVNQEVYVAYRIVQLPAVMPPQSYGISFTVTDLT